MFALELIDLTPNEKFGPGPADKLCKLTRIKTETKWVAMVEVFLDVQMWFEPLDFVLSEILGEWDILLIHRYDAHLATVAALYDYIVKQC